jgi:hypothetical protein
MTAMKKIGFRRKQYTNLFFAIGVVSSLFTATFAPWFEGQAGAAPPPPGVSNMIVYSREEAFSVDEIRPKIKGQTCYAQFSTAPRTEGFLLDQVFVSQAQYNRVAQDSTATGNVDPVFITKVGNFDDVPANLGLLYPLLPYGDLWHVVHDPGDIQVIKFVPSEAPPPPVNATASDPPTGGNSVCEGMTLLKIGNRYVGRQFHVENISFDAQDYRVVRYEPSSGNVNSGTIFYPDITTTRFNNLNRTPFVIDGVEGRPPGGGIGRGTVDAAWIDAGHIRITSGDHTGEQYQKFKWSAAENRSLYFLVAAGGNRQDIVWNSGKGCEDPIDDRGNPAPCPGSVQHCVPFIVIDQAINVNRSGADFLINGADARSFESRTNRLGGATARLFDYDPADCGRGYIREDNVTLGEQFRSKIWFYFSQSANKMITVFTQGDGNENNFRGEYAHADGTPDTQYRGGRNGCSGIADFVSGPHAPPIRSLSWKFTDGQCASPVSKTYGTVGVLALGGPEGEAAFQATVGAQDPGGDAGTPQPRVGCSAIPNNPFGWLFCRLIDDVFVPFIETATAEINSLMNIDVGSIFDDNRNTGLAFHQVWAAFRTFALLIIVIAALIMVIAQASSFEIVDAYTVRKILPGLIIAAVGITLSWPLMEAAVTISNDLGQNIRTVIYTPFASLSTQGLSISNLTASLGGFFLLGGALAYGITGLFLLAATLALSVAIAYLVLILRIMLISFLVVIAPLAIACYVLPGTRRFSTLWLNTLLAMLLAYVLVSALFAVCDVFAVTMMATSNAGAPAASPMAALAYLAFSQTVGHTGAVIVQIFKFAITWNVVKSSVKQVSVIAGIFENTTKGARGWLANRQAQGLKTRGQKAAQGTLFNGTRFIPGSRTAANAVNRITAGAATGISGHFGLPTARGRAAIGQMRFGAADQLAKSEAFHRIKENDDALRAATYRSSGEAMSALIARWGNNEEGRARARNAVAAVQTSVGFGAVQQIASSKAMIDTGTAYENMEDWARTAARVSNGNKGVLADVVGYGNAAAKKNRMDLTPGYGDLFRVAERVMEGGRVTQGTWDGLTIQALRNSGAPTTIASQAKKAVYDNLTAIAQRSEGARRSAATADAYGFADAGFTPDAMRSEIIDMAVELARANYAAGSAQASSQAFSTIDTLVARGAMSRSEAEARVQRGSARAFAQGVPPEARGG